MRIDKYLAHAGLGTRKEVKKFLKEKRVKVNGEIIKSDKTKINENDIVEFDDVVITYDELVYFMLNKPAGYVSATEDNYDPTVIELIDDFHKDLFPVGRLDKDTEGLLLISNDGKLAHRLLSPKHHVPKTYYATIDGVVDEEDIAAFKAGIELDDFTCMPAVLKILSTTDATSEIEVTIMEGKFHQVKRMFIARGKEVTYLKRLTMGALKLDESLELGEFRELTDEEYNSLVSDDML